MTKREQTQNEYKYATAHAIYSPDLSLLQKTKALENSP